MKNELEIFRNNRDNAFDNMVEAGWSGEAFEAAKSDYDQAMVGIITVYGGQELTPGHEDIDLFSAYSDCYKSDNGFRPRGEISLKGIQEWFAHRETYIDDMIADDRERDARAYGDFELTVSKTIEAGAKDRATALRWLFAETDCGVEHALFGYGLSYEDGIAMEREIRTALKAAS